MVNSERYRVNAVVAATLREAAALLVLQNADPFRVAAYRRAATTIAELDRDIASIAAQGPEAVEALPRIGRNIAAGIVELVSTGRWSFLDRLHGELQPETAFQSIPGIGPKMARQIHEHLHVDTLEALETAAHDGRLAAVPGIGERRSAIIRNSLASILARRRPEPPTDVLYERPSVDLLLNIDREYRDKAKAGELKLIAPKRFNPNGKAWLPILHAERGTWHFTVLFSNTARAHELAKTDDWVVIFYSADHLHEDQCTVVTETSGSLKGRRVVRGREAECAEYWERRLQGQHLD